MTIKVKILAGTMLALLCIVFGPGLWLAIASGPAQPSGQATTDDLPTLTGPLPSEESLVGTPVPEDASQPGLTATEPVTSTQIVTITETPAPTLAVEPSITNPQAALPARYFPLVFHQPLPGPPESLLFCSNLPNPLAIPDNDPGGLNNQITINDPRWLLDLDLQLYISHNWVGDVAVRLTHVETGQSITLVDQPGKPASEQGCSLDGINAILDDEAILPVEDRCAGGYSPAAIAGIYLPQEPLRGLEGEPANGTWVLNVSDHFKNDTGKLRSWCMSATLSESRILPETPPPLTGLPPSARVAGITGQKQALPLDCETRVAVDYAGFFGKAINEFEFLSRLPLSDNPDRGFVGDVYGAWGQIPPNPYGVHAEPVAAVLRDYGVEAYAHRPLPWDVAQAEIAAGRPVYVFVIGSGDLWNQSPVYYFSKDGARTIVAPYEHTVMLTGYTESEAIILDGGVTFRMPLGQFLSSWSALGNMAIISHP